jgi:DNA-binding LacI/PurR family transcriptional regulator
MRHHGLDPQVIIAGDDESDAAEGIDRIAGLDQPPTAIFAFNDLLAAGALDRLDDIGLSVPGDISMVSYDNTFIAGLHHMSLTTVNQPRIEMGKIAIELITERIEGERATPARRSLEPTLVVRSSTGSPNPKDRS